jgi:type II secretory pathway pseudopilin PulG
MRTALGRRAKSTDYAAEPAESVARVSARGFTLMEMMIVLLVIFMLMGLLIGGIHLATGSTRKVADRVTAQSLKNAAVQFQQQFSFPMPLIKDAQPLTASASRQPNVYNLAVANDLTILRTSPPPDQLDPRFSICSIPYYLMGVADFPRDPGNANGQVIDGFKGAGFKSVRRDGSFETAGATHSPFFDVSRNAKAVFTIDFANGVVVLRDRNDVAFRYYRWEHNDTVAAIADLNVPLIIGDAKTDERLKSATAAILGAGPNGVFGNEDQILAVYGANHPQALTIDQMQTKVGVSGNAQDPAIQTKIRQAAIADNIMEPLQ